MSEPITFEVKYTYSTPAERLFKAEQELHNALFDGAESGVLAEFNVQKHGNGTEIPFMVLKQFIPRAR